MFAGDGEVEALWSGERKSASDFRRARFGAFSGRLGRQMKRWLSGAPVCCEDCCEYLACFDEDEGNPRRDVGAKNTSRPSRSRR